MTTSLTQLMAASAAILTLERLASSGLLPEHEEQNIRLLALRVGKAFELDSKAERGDNVFELVREPATVYRR